MPKKFSYSVNKKYEKNILKRYDETRNNREQETMTRIDTLNKMVTSQYINEGNSIDANAAGALGAALKDAFKVNQGNKDRVSKYERKVIASRLKEQNGIELGFFEARRLKKNEEKLKRWTKAYQDNLVSMQSYMQQKTNEFSLQMVSGRYQTWYTQQLNMIVQDAIKTPAEEMQNRGIYHVKGALKDSRPAVKEPDPAKGQKAQEKYEQKRQEIKEKYSLHETDKEREERLNDETFETLDDVNLNEYTEPTEDVIEALDGTTVEIPDRDPNASFADMSGMRRVNSFPPPDKKPMDLGLQSPTVQRGSQPATAAPAQQYKVGSKGFTDLAATKKTQEIGK